MASPDAATPKGGSKYDAQVKLYWLEKSRSQRVLWLLEELKIPYDIQTFKRGKDMLAPPELKEVHPLGKAPVVSVTAKGGKPLVLAESAAIVEYLSDHFGPWLIPTRYPEGKEGQAGGETEEWLRYRFFMHYAEGSLMGYLIVALIVGNIRKAPVPFFIRPITNGIASKIESNFLTPNFKTHFTFLEGQLASSPNEGQFLCGEKLTGADILMSFPLEASKGRVGLTPEQYPKLCAYVDRIHEREAYKEAVNKIVEIEGKYDPNL